MCMVWLLTDFFAHIVMRLNEALVDGFEDVVITGRPEASLTDNVMTQVVFGVLRGHITAVSVKDTQIDVLQLIVTIKLVLEVVVILHILAAALTARGVHPEPDGHRHPRRWWWWWWWWC